MNTTKESAMAASTYLKKHGNNVINLAMLSDDLM